MLGVKDTELAPNVTLVIFRIAIAGVHIKRLLTDVTLTLAVLSVSLNGQGNTIALIMKTAYTTVVIRYILALIAAS